MDRDKCNKCDTQHDMKTKKKKYEKSKRKIFVSLNNKQHHHNNISKSDSMNKNDRFTICASI